MLVVVEAGERSMVADRGANARLTPDTCRDSLDAGAVLVSGYLLLQEPTTPAGLAALERAACDRSSRSRPSSWPLVEAFGAARFLSETTDGGRERRCWPTNVRLRCSTVCSGTAAARAWGSATASRA